MSLNYLAYVDGGYRLRQRSCLTIILSFIFHLNATIFLCTHLVLSFISTSLLVWIWLVLKLLYFFVLANSSWHFYQGWNDYAYLSSRLYLLRIIFNCWLVEKILNVCSWFTSKTFICLKKVKTFLFLNCSSPNVRFNHQSIKANKHPLILCEIFATYIND